MKIALAAGSNVLQAGFGEVNRVASTYGPVVVAQAKVVVTEHAPKVAGVVRSGFLFRVFRLLLMVGFICSTLV